MDLDVRHRGKKKKGNNESTNRFVEGCLGDSARKGEPEEKVGEDGQVENMGYKR